jgi:hypothetical protein
VDGKVKSSILSALEYDIRFALKLVNRNDGKTVSRVIYSEDGAFQFSETRFDYCLRFDGYWQVRTGFGTSSAVEMCNYQC